MSLHAPYTYVRMTTSTPHGYHVPLSISFAVITRKPREVMKSVSSMGGEFLLSRPQTRVG